jgi:hypothetical protein
MSWTSPTSHSDPDSVWADETKVYDGDTGTHAYTTTANKNLELNISPTITCDKVRIYAEEEVVPGTDLNPNVYIDLYYDSAWNNIFGGTITKTTWVEKTITAGIKSVTKARVRSPIDQGGTQFNLFEFEFNSITRPKLGDEWEVQQAAGAIIGDSGPKLE